jgi:hypothetical protein
MTWDICRSGSSILGGSIEFSWSCEKGAVLILPRGASREKLWDNDRFMNYAQQNAPQWFKYAGRRRHWEPNGETSKILYVITGCVKTSAWAMATVSNNSGSASLSLCAAAPVVQGNAACSYQWQRQSPAFVHSGPRIPSDRENQCVFVQGFSIKLRKGVGFARLGRKIQIDIADMSGTKTQNFGGKGSGGISQLRSGNVPGSVTSGPGRQNQEPTELDEQMPGNKDHIEIRTFPDVPKVPHFC